MRRLLTPRRSPPCFALVIPPCFPASLPPRPLLARAARQARAVLEHQESNFKTMLHDRKKALQAKL
jgi:hypothetical protein